MSTFDMSGEKYPHLVSGEFNARVTAEKAINTLLRRGELKRKQVDLIQPDDKHLGRKVEPESPGVRHTLMRSHAIFGVGGLVAGLVLASVLVILGPEATRSSPLMTFIGLGIISTFLGLLVAGLFTL
uniref:hypothetical protein n=1 Tax=Pseudomaricurvus sp. TaxID=2004510 RepID=UPI003F6AE127